MNRDRVENNWKQFKDNADERPWDELAFDDLLVNSIRKTYGSADDETERQLTEWQARLK